MTTSYSTKAMTTEPTQTVRTDISLDMHPASKRIAELEKASKERLDVLHWLAPKIRDELRDSPTFLHAISTDAGKEYCHRDENLTDEVADENAILREKIAELEKQVKLHCADWADDDTRVKEIAAKHGIKTDDEYGFLSVIDMAERMSERIAELESRVKQLEGALLLDTPWPITEILANLHDATDHLFKIHDCDHHGYEMWLQAQIQAVTCCQLLTDALSPSPPAVEVERWAKEKAAHKAERRIQSQTKGSKVWVRALWPAWRDECNYRIHPDDDTPTVQTEDIEHGETYEEFVEGKLHAERFLHDDTPQREEKPATVPLAVAEGLADALKELTNYAAVQEPVWATSITRSARKALATFQASTKE